MCVWGGGGACRCVWGGVGVHVGVCVGVHVGVCVGGCM